MGQGARLGIDYGTSNTVAVLHTPGRPSRVLLFDGSPQLPSVIFADPVTGLLAGRDAAHAARTDPTRVEPNPKRRVNDQVILLGEATFHVGSLIAATLSRVREEAERVCGGQISQSVLTHPAAWGAQRRGVLAEAALAAGLGSPELVPEPVAAAGYFVWVLGARLPVGQCLVVYDFGAGTFDASVVRRTHEGFSVLATEGLPETGGLDVDAAIVSAIVEGGANWDPAIRARLESPQSAEDRRVRGLLWEDVRSAKEMLSRASSTFIHVPMVDVDVPLGREQFEQIARPILEETMAATVRAVRASGIRAAEIAGVFPVGGSSRIPLATTLLHRALSTTPTVLDQPELVVAEGAAVARHGPQATPVVPALPTATMMHPVSPVVPALPAAATVIQPVVPALEAGKGRGLRAGLGRHGCSPALAIVVLLLLVIGTCGFVVNRLKHDGVIGGGGGAATPSVTSPSPSPSRLLSPSPSTVRMVFPASMAGTWVGPLEQSNGKTWSMQVTIKGGSATAAVSYPTLGCSGTWTAVSVKGAVVTAEEMITSGTCTKRGRVGAELAGTATLLLEYAPEGASYTGTATLTRS